MEVLLEKIEDLSDGLVHFFTVFIDGDAESEYEKFLNKDFPDHAEEMAILDSVIEEMKWRGAKQWYFKPERAASALPRVAEDVIAANTEDDFGIRLYCIRITENIVVLLNGGIKTELKPEKCKNVGWFFKCANAIARVIERAIIDKDLLPNKPDSFDQYQFEV